jgi:hypothetical protein
MAFLPNKAELEAFEAKVTQYQQQLDAALIEFERERSALSFTEMAASSSLYADPRKLARRP